jgi:hypothetical protein
MMDGGGEVMVYETPAEFLVKRLRQLADCDARAGEPLGKCMREAAAEIENLVYDRDMWMDLFCATQDPQYDGRHQPDIKPDIVARLRAVSPMIDQTVICSEAADIIEDMACRVEEALRAVRKDISETRAALMPTPLPGEPVATDTQKEPA